MYYNSGIQEVSPNGVVRASLNQAFTFICVAQGSGVFWFANNLHVSELEGTLPLKLEESITVSLDSAGCARQRNLTGIATPLANNISLTCLTLGIPMPSPQILLRVEGITAYIHSLGSPQGLYSYRSHKTALARTIFLFVLITSASPIIRKGILIHFDR